MLLIQKDIVCIDKYGIPTEDYDVIKGYRADASYFYIAKAFVRDEVDVDILEELLSLGGLGIQYCIKSQKAFDNLIEIILPVIFGCVLAFFLNIMREILPQEKR